tara:strand:- start:715 stop:864 length:150 start_codon:yes stop_codon:yes gene_type:complete
MNDITEEEIYEFLVELEYFAHHHLDGENIKVILMEIISSFKEKCELSNI